MSERSTADRSLFFDHLIEAALSVLSEGMTEKSHETVSLPDLPKAPKVASGPKASELKAKVEAEADCGCALGMFATGGIVLSIKKFLIDAALFFVFSLVAFCL